MSHEDFGGPPALIAALGGPPQDCPRCGRPSGNCTAGEPCAAQDGRPLCAECGRHGVPALAALVELARVACALGGVLRHGRGEVPLAVLLRLARAAEQYHRHTAPAERTVP